MVGKIQCLICFGLLGPRRHPSRAADIDALGRLRFARISRFTKLARLDTNQSGMPPRMYSTTREKRKHFDAVMKHERVFERPQSLPFEVIVVDSFDGVCLRRAYTDIKVDEQLGKLESIDAVDLNYIKWLPSSVALREVPSLPLRIPAHGNSFRT